MIDDLPLRWAVTGLFLLSAVGFALVTDRRSWTSVVSYGLHLTMAIAMAAMAWPQALGLPPTPAEVFFVAAALWFAITAVLATRMIATRLVRGYHALKMLAMAWMYAVAHQHPHADGLGAEHRMPPNTEMPGMDPNMDPNMEMPDMEMPDVSGTDAHASDNLPGWVDAGNWVWTVLFVVAAVVLGYGLVSQRSASRRRRARSWRSTVSTAVQLMMAAGMAIMFGTLLVQD
jgi:uncharacterized membrane protein SirB2